jgi:phage-related protein
MDNDDKILGWLYGSIKSPPFSDAARSYAGHLLRALQKGQLLDMPDSRPMPSVGPRCHELRINDAQTNKIWRIMYRIDSDAILIIDVFAKKTQKTPKRVIEACQKRLKAYDAE